MKVLPKLIVIFALCLAEVLLVTLTNPQSVPAAVLIIPFIIVYLIFFYTLSALAKRNIRSLGGRFNPKRLSLAAIVAALPVLMLALQSTGQLTVRDAVTILILIVILCFYVSRLSFAKNK